jgi:hypothetical protein
MMSILEFYVKLRREIIAVICGVEDSHNYLFWDNTTPNYTTKSNLSIIYDRYIKHSEAFGVYMIDRHCDCGSPSHNEIGSDGYVMDYILDPNIKFGDSRFIWENTFDKGDIESICPCAKSNLSSKHRVLQQVCFDAEADQSICKTIDGIFDDLYQAIRNAGDKQPRSAIREYLLRAVIKINDAILPCTMDEYIEHQMELAGLKH